MIETLRAVLGNKELKYLVFHLAKKTYQKCGKWNVERLEWAPVWEELGVAVYKESQLGVSLGGSALEVHRCKGSLARIVEQP